MTKGDKRSMTKTTTARTVPVDSLVLYTDQEGTFCYKGSIDGPFAEIGFGFGRATNTVRCDVQQVAPADITVPPSDARVAVVKQAKGHYPTWKGPWLLSIDGEATGRFFNTKKEGTATGLRTVAIRDWHAATPTSEETAS